MEETPIQSPPTTPPPARPYRGSQFSGNKKKFALIGAIVLLAIAIPTTIFLSQQDTDNRQRAAELPQGVTVNVSVSPAESTTSCPANITFTGTITSSKAQTLTYNWYRSDDWYLPNETITFDAPGTKTVSKTWNVGANGDPSFNPYEGWMAIRIHPNNTPTVTASPSATMTPTNTPTSTPTITPTPATVFITKNVTCGTGSKTPEQLCKESGYTRSGSLASSDGSSVSAIGFWWKQCGGASITFGSGFQYTINNLDCTGRNDAWGNQNIPPAQYPGFFIKVGQATTVYDPLEKVGLTGITCAQHNPGYTMRLACIKDSGSVPAVPAQPQL